MINPEDEFVLDIVDENNEYIVVEGIQQKKFQINASGWLLRQKNDSKLPKYTVNELPVTADDWDNLTDE